jgi:hypothetical protein
MKLKIESKWGRSFLVDRYGRWIAYDQATKLKTADARAFVRSEKNRVKTALASDQYIAPKTQRYYQSVLGGAA